MDIDKVSSGIFKGVKKVADGIAKGTQLAANGVAAGVQKTAETIKSNNHKKPEKEELRKGKQKKMKKEKLTKPEEKVKSTAESLQHVIIEPKNSGMKILFPDGYQELPVKRDPDMKKEKELYPDLSFYQKIVGNCDAQIMVFRTTAERAMDFNDVQGLIDGIHQDMADNQGLICVDAGTTKRGWPYIYSIVKTLKKDPIGVLYFLRMNLKKDDQYFEIIASFDEIGMTGSRESIAGCYAMNLGLYTIEVENGKMVGWSEDPYDPSYTRGIPMNLSERVGLDGLFPGNPLSQAREFVLAVTKDELVLIKKEDSSEEKEKEDTENEEQPDDETVDEQKKKDSDELLRSLFEKSDRCRRHTYPVEIE